MRRLAFVILLGLATACGSAQRTGQCRVRYVPAAPPPPSASGGVAATSPAGVTMAPQPSAPPVSAQMEATRVTTSGADESGAGEERDCVTEVPVNAAPVLAQPATPEQPPDPIGAQEAIIHRDQAVLASGTAACRDVCLAAGNICTAASEICHLAGDGHTRCARARGACTDASRRRDGACPVCPSAR